MTIQDRALKLLEARPWLSAAQVAKAIKANCASVSSILLQLVRKGTLIRINHYGPRGGYIYALAGTPRFDENRVTVSVGAEKTLSRYDMILKDDLV